MLCVLLIHWKVVTCNNNKGIFGNSTKASNKGNIESFYLLFQPCWIWWEMGGEGTVMHFTHKSADQNSELCGGKYPSNSLKYAPCIFRQNFVSDVILNATWNIAFWSLGCVESSSSFGAVMEAINGSLNTALFLPGSKSPLSLAFIKLFIMILGFIRRLQKNKTTPALEVTNWIKIRLVDNRSPLLHSLVLFLYLFKKRSSLVPSYYHSTISALPTSIPRSLSKSKECWNLIQTSKL